MLETHEIETAPNPRTTLMVLHGLGADGYDFVPICGELDLSAIGPVRYVFPHAPQRPVTINNGYLMRAWYDIRVADLVRQEDEGGLRESQRQIAELIDRERERGVPAARIVVMGFSQGCAMTLMTALRYPERLGGAVGMSGYLPLASLAPVWSGPRFSSMCGKENVLRSVAPHPPPPPPPPPLPPRDHQPFFLVIGPLDSSMCGTT